MLEDIHSIRQFLHYGYLIGGHIELPVPLEQDGRDRRLASRRVSLNALVCEGVDRLSAACRTALSSCVGTSMHVVPISGGMDSRAILGGLLGSVDRSRITTVTFGTPGTWDFDIGRLVAKEADVTNVQIDLSEVTWDIESLVRFAGECERPIALFEAYLFHLMRTRFGCNCVYWSGFMGDPLSGSHLLRRDSVTWDRARIRFAARNRFARSIPLSAPGYEPQDCLPQTPPLDHDDLCYDEQLDFGIRQQCCVRPVVLLKGYDYCAPFLQPEWAGFVLSVPRPCREKQFLYKEILKRAYPKLFSLPVKNSLGLPLTAPRWRRSLRRQGLRVRAAVKRFFPWVDWGISPGLNYIDFDRGVRERADLKATIHESIQDLKKRGIVDWIDMDAIWNRHQRRQGNHADALTLLASLEINLKTQEMRAR